MSETDLKKFAVTFVGTLSQDVETPGFQYLGDPSQAHRCVAPAVCSKWFNSFPCRPKEVTVEVRVFGKQVKKKVIFWDETCFDDPEDFASYKPVPDLWPVMAIASCLDTPLRPASLTKPLRRL